MLLTEWQTDRLTDICIPRAAFAAEKKMYLNFFLETWRDNELKTTCIMRVQSWFYFKCLSEVTVWETWIATEGNI